MKKRLLILGVLAGAMVLLVGVVNTTIDDFFMPGSQPGQSGNLEHPDKCDNCHGGYDLSVEPAFNWRGSMMAQAARDPLYLACLAIANQDAPQSGDLCIRCHAPDGWLNGRSEPTDGSALNSNDREGVQCDFCHKLVQPSALGVNLHADDQAYTEGTYPSDQDYLATLSMIPPQSGNGMYIAHSANAKRGPFVDAAARHQMHYSPFHSQSDICATCHDVSNPVYSRGEEGNYALNSIGAPAPGFETYQMLPIERTYSEWKMSAYNTPEGVASDVFGGNKANVSSCQDCHMKDVSGFGCNKKGVPYRTDLPLHDMTGGNTFVPGLIAQTHSDEVNEAALLAGVSRAKGMLQSAASLTLIVQPADNGYTAQVRVTNETGHKMPSGYPEGRRIWLHVTAYDVDGALLFESGHYDAAGATLNTDGAKVYEIKLGMSEGVAAAATAGGSKVYEPGESFHFVLNDAVLKDNRIPPRGFTNANFEAIQSPVVAYTYPDGQYWDDTEYVLPSETFHVRVRLLYQTVSKEYVEFLRDENTTNDAGQLLYNLWESHGKSTPVIMSEAEYYNGVPPVKYLHIARASLLRQALKGGRTQMEATLDIADADGNPLDGAEVAGQFSGSTNDQVSGTSNAQGQVVLTSSSTRNADLLWCLLVETIHKDGYVLETPVEICETTQKAIREQTTSGAKAGLNDFFAYPNPAQDDVHVRFTLMQEQNVLIQLYTMEGAEMLSHRTGSLSAGSHDVRLPTRELKPGVYLIRMQYAGVSQTTLVTRE